MSTIATDAIASFEGLQPQQQAELDKILAWMTRRDPRQQGGDELKWQKPTFRLPEGAEEWFDDNPDDYFVLRGFAGVGKTVLVGELIMEATAAGWNIAVTAPTNKAVSILQEKVRAIAKTRVVNATFSSLHSVCGLRMVEGDDGEHKISSTGYTKFDGVNLLIVDEASMVDSKMLLRSIQNSRGRTLVLFVGDPGQLEPVMEGSMSKVFTLPQKSTMTKIIRQAEGNPLIEASMFIRRKNRIEDILNAPTVDEQQRIISSLGPDDRVQVSDLMDLLPDSMVKRNRLQGIGIGLQREGRDARILAYTNRAVLDYNREIHFDLFPESVPLQFSAGERVIVQSATKAENIDTGKDVDLVTSEELVIEYVEMGEHNQYPGFTCYIMILRDDLGNLVKVHTPKLMNALNNRLAELFGEVQDLKQLHHHNPRDLNLKEKYTQARTAAWLYKNSFADIRHTYSMTTHKSQGSTFDSVLIDLPNLMQMPTTFAYNTALYVAVTRARFDAVIGY
jgi:exodeoxyribonuclease-5